MQFDNNKPTDDFVRKNEQIRYYEVLVVQDGKKLGVFSSREAQVMARDVGLDLIEVSPQAKPPVCAIMDYGKYKYERGKNQKNKSNSIKEKEVAFRYTIDRHDLVTKINQAAKFLLNGDRVKLLVKFEGRENAHRDQGFEMIDKALEMLKNVAIIEKAPSLEGKTIIARLISNGGKVNPEKPEIKVG